MLRVWRVVLCLGVALAAALGVALAPVPAGAQSKCTSQKLTGAGGYFASFAKCLAKGVAKGMSPDPLCVAKAQEKLAAGFEKAERKGDCLTIGDFLPVQDVLDDALPDTAEALTPPPPGCCEAAGGCAFVASDLICTGFGGVPGAAGTVCTADGTCVAPGAVEAGSCCDGIAEMFGVGECAVGPIIEFSCAAEGLETIEGTCEPSGCVAAGAEPRSRCTAAKLKAVGSYFKATAKCEAKGVAKGNAAELVCLGKAQSKLQKAFSRAEAKGDCFGFGDLAGAQGPVDDALALSFEILEAQLSVCCEGATACWWTESDAACELSLSATPGAPGTICGGDGACAAPPVPEGPCCSDLTIGPDSGRCAGGYSQVDCTNDGGTFLSDAVCLPAQLCID